jgi:23S rRNA (adenine2503-C2)-methyltransferase
MNQDLIQEIIKDEPKFRKKQVNEALYANLISEWCEATNLPKPLREYLDQKAPIKSDYRLETSEDKNTLKAAIKLIDGKEVETVLMKSKDRNTVCVSSQVGCPMGCAFCATGTMGFSRNLDSDEIVEQVLVFARELKKSDQKVTNIVFMGMGEPLLNYQNVLTAIRFLHRSDTLGLGMRRFSISTCGITPGIISMSEDIPEVNLAISLHSANDSIRSKLMKVNTSYPLDELSETFKQYYKKTKRKIMFEYILLSGINTSKEDARNLAEYIRGLDVSYVVNLIPFNQTKHSDFSSPSRDELEEFKNILQKVGLNFVQRKEYGRGISAACGQLVKKLS